MPQLAKIIEFTDPTGDVLAVRMPADGEGVIEWGSQLIVRDSQVALFYRDGKLMTAFEPGRYVLTTQNVPVLTKLVTGLVYGSGETPFRAEVYFVAKHLFTDLRWGTPEPVYIPDPILMQLPIRANGRFAIRVADPSIFVPKLVGTRPFCRASDVEDYLRQQYLVAALTDGVASLGKPFAELPRYYRELGVGIKSLLASEFASLGLELAELSVISVTTTEEMQAQFTRNSDIAGKGYATARGTQYDLEAKAAGAVALRQAGTDYQQVGMTDAMKTLAANPGDASSAGAGTGPMQTGLHLGMAMAVPQMLNQMLGQAKAGEPVAAASANEPKVDAFAKIKQLKELLDLGAITQAEFDAKKAEFLKQI